MDPPLEYYQLDLDRKIEKGGGKDSPDQQKHPRAIDRKKNRREDKEMNKVV
jgi:hypothetical protein